MKKLLWEVRLLSPPSAIRYCKACGKNTEFLCSESFRINAQQKHLDIWLIYHCAGCNTTWNLPLYSRIHPGKLPPNRLERFYQNDPALATEYAANTSILKQNGAKIGKLNYQITGSLPDWSEATQVVIHCKFPIKLKFSAILREKLSLSRDQLTQLADRGVIQCPDGQNPARVCLYGKIALRLHPPPNAKTDGSSTHI